MCKVIYSRAVALLGTCGKSEVTSGRKERGGFEDVVQMIGESGQCDRSPRRL